MLKIITVFNWIGVGALAILVLALLFEPSRGGDAATKGLGGAFIMIGLVAMAVLITLNLLPYTWTKYVGFILMISPFALYVMNAKWSKYKAASKLEIPIGFEADGKPWFQDAHKQTLAIAIFNGEADKVKQLLQGPHGRMLLEKGNEQQTILEFALSEVIFSSSQLEGKFVCVKALFEAGVKLGANADPDYFITAAADAGSAALVQLLLEQGADANARNTMGSPALFEAIITTEEPNEKVEILLAAGANPNSLRQESETESTTALHCAARVGRWNICRQLIAKGADARFVLSDGLTVESMIREQGDDFQGDNYSTADDLKQLKKQLGL